MSTTIETAANANLNTWFGWSIDNELDLSNLVRDGVDPSVINTLIEHGFKKQELNWVIPSRTLSHRVSKSEKLTRDESAKVIRAARLTAQAVAVFGNEQKANNWLSKPKKKLDGRTPKEAMQDEFGGNIVEQLLLRIESGYF
ncbi:type II RES/Xre toxin-antitoxin system antitoxin [Vibrio atypicus]|jgi:putative toxin-antitoxin system antitoxin component (TIGR02293 family)|uniref:type II RES/Xre toxin-antitoxin system antitoxin n=1 Tax=Vibrio atypicus TaxID=558271 RepID=UPI00135BFDE0|nr:antitoxin Xre/MbcA/ParS toxin-binding domain-containing protein [Vibrio atypicus]